MRVINFVNLIVGLLGNHAIDGNRSKCNHCDGHDADKKNKKECLEVRGRSFCCDFGCFKSLLSEIFLLLIGRINGVLGVLY